jgi:hypothetical protein
MMLHAFICLLFAGLVCGFSPVLTVAGLVGAVLFMVQR